MATKTSGNWELVYDGNDSVDCVKIKKITIFPKKCLSDFAISQMALHFGMKVLNLNNFENQFFLK
jgi:hypothetical protein